MTDKKTLKFQMMMSPEEAKVLDDWMFENRIRSRAEAIRRLCQIGLATESVGGRMVESASRLNEALAQVSGAEGDLKRRWDGVANTGEFKNLPKEQVELRMLLIWNRIENDIRALQSARLSAKDARIPVALAPGYTSDFVGISAGSSDLLESIAASVDEAKK